MILVCCIDRNYAELAGVMLRSVHCNGNVPTAEFLVLGDNLTLSDKENITAAAGRPVEFIDLDKAMIDRIKFLPTTSSWSRSTYARLILPELLHQSERIVYLDADIIVKSDISYLFTMELNNQLMAAVGAEGERVAEFNRSLNRPDDTFYFSAGVLVIDAEKWRSEGLTDKAFSLLASRRFNFLDQDVLNLLATGRVIELDWRWNAQKDDDFTKAAIVHFTHEKPNFVECQHPETQEFRKLRAETPWAAQPLRTKRYKRIHRLKHSIRKRWLAFLTRLPMRTQHPH